MYELKTTGFSPRALAYSRAWCSSDTLTVAAVVQPNLAGRLYQEAAVERQSLVLVTSDYVM